MPDIYLGKQFGVLTVAGDYKPGDPPPTLYTDWQDWAAVQLKAGLKQKRCGRCSKWKFPQELSAVIDKTPATTARRKRVVVSSPVCIACVGKVGAK